jgi:hypothetical protein
MNLDDTQNYVSIASEAVASEALAYDTRAGDTIYIIARAKSAHCIAYGMGRSHAGERNDAPTIRKQHRHCQFTRPRWGDCEQRIVIAEPPPATTTGS